MIAAGSSPVAAGVELLVRLPQRQRDPDLGDADRWQAYATRLAGLESRTVLWTHETESEPSVAALLRRLDLVLWPVVPNMPAYLREASDHGVLGAATQRFRRLRLADQARIALHQLPRAGKVLARDFATGILVLVEMELARLRRYRPAVALLSASVTDLALALGHAGLLREFVRLVARAWGLQPGLATHNFGSLAPFLRAHGIRPVVILAPFNARGYLMNPSQPECERAAGAIGAEVVASHVDVGGRLSRAEALAYLTGLGLRRGVVELEV